MNNLERPAREETTISATAGDEMEDVRQISDGVYEAESEDLEDEEHITKILEMMEYLKKASLRQENVLKNMDTRLNSIQETFDWFLMR
jgi:uncharacterized protein YgfB (UPF0149 family)